MKKSLLLALPLLLCSCSGSKFDKSTTYSCTIENYTCKLNCKEEAGILQSLGTSANRCLYTKITYIDNFNDEKVYFDGKFSLYNTDNLYYHYDTLFLISGFDSSNKEWVLPLNIYKLKVSGTKIDFNYHKFYEAK